MLILSWCELKLILKGIASGWKRDSVQSPGLTVPVRGKSPACRKLNELFPVYDRRIQVKDLKQISSNAASQRLAAHLNGRAGLANVKRQALQSNSRLIDASSSSSYNPPSTQLPSPQIRRVVSNSDDIFITSLSRRVPPRSPTRRHWIL